MKKVNWMGCLFLFVSFFYVGSASAVIISFSPASQTVNVNDIFDVDIVISDLIAADGTREIVSAFDLDVLYDSSVLNATTVTFGSSLGDPFFAETFVDSELSVDSVLSQGRIDLSELSLLSNAALLALQPNASFTLATLSFEALAEGSSSLSFDPIASPGVDVKGIDPFVPFDLSNTTGQGQIIVAPQSIPEPNILILMITGLLGLAMVKKHAFNRVKNLCCKKS